MDVLNSVSSINDAVYMYDSFKQHTTKDSTQKDFYTKKNNCSWKIRTLFYKTLVILVLLPIIILIILNSLIGIQIFKLNLFLGLWIFIGIIYTFIYTNMMIDVKLIKLNQSNNLNKIEHCNF